MGFFLINNRPFEITEFNPFVILFFFFLDMVDSLNVHLTQKAHLYLFGPGLRYKVALEIDSMIFLKKISFDNRILAPLKIIYGYHLINNQMVYGIQECNKWHRVLAENLLIQIKLICQLRDSTKQLLILF